MILAVAAGIAAARTYSAIVPIPQSVVPGEGRCLLQEGTAVYASEGLDFEVDYLLGHLAHVMSFEIPRTMEPWEGGTVPDTGRRVCSGGLQAGSDTGRSTG